MTEKDKTIQDLRRAIDLLREELRKKDRMIAELEKTLEEVRRAVDDFMQEG